MQTNPLRFTHFRVWKVVVPARSDILSAPVAKGPIYRANLSWPEMPIHLVEGVTSGGFSAVGECDRGTPRDVVEATLRDLLDRDLLSMNPATVWMDDTDPVGLPGAYPLWSWQPRRIAAICSWSRSGAMRSAGQRGCPRINSLAAPCATASRPISGPIVRLHPYWPASWRRQVGRVSRG
ncbi:MAG: hypothetical protein HC802_06080 [Caldilineaceae bacterium]|nr:hypothetical protein [Caldilineaceae bacterium]